jgi:aspartate aminotransferase
MAGMAIQMTGGRASAPAGGSPAGRPSAGRRVSARLSAVAPSATLAIDAKYKALQAEGHDVIGFGAGEPDVPTPAEVVEAAVAACRDQANHCYTPAAGLPELRQAIAAKTARDSGLRVEPSQVLVTNGGKQAIFNACAALLDPGDEVLLPAPYWTTYPEAIALAGGVPVVVETSEESGFRARVDQLERAVSARTKALLFNSPSNPTGAVYPPAEVEAIGRWAADRGLWVVTDEIYEHLVYWSGPVPPPSIPVVVPELADRFVVINGVAKTYAMTGWRVGWMIGPPDLVAAAANFQSHATSNVANVSQRAALAALSGDLHAVAAMREAFDRRRRRMCELLAAAPGVTCVEPQGAFYAFPNVRALLGRAFGDRVPKTTTELAEVVLDRVKVAVVPGEAFGAPGYFRLSYALADAAMEEGVNRLVRLAASVASLPAAATRDTAG